MNNKTIAYQDGELISELLTDRQNIYLENHEKTVMAITDGKFTRDAVHFKNNRPVAQSKITTINPENNFAEGMYSRIFKSGKVVHKKKFIVDFNKKTETIFNDPHGNGISEIRKLDKNYATIESHSYYPNRNLKSIEKFKNNLRHGNCLYFYDGKQRIAKGDLSTEKRDLEELKEFDQGILIKNSIFDQIGRLAWFMTGTKKSADDDLYREYFYNEEDYDVRYSNTSYMYQKNKYLLDLPLNRTIFNQDGKAIYLECNNYVQEMYAHINNVQASALVLNDSVQYFPNEWDEDGDGDVTAGTVKYFNRNELVSSGKFKNLNGDFINEGVHLVKDEGVVTYLNGEVQSKDKKEIFEDNGELIIRQNNPSSQEDQVSSAEFSPT